MAVSGDEHPIDPSVARRWKAFERGPREQWLRCEGSLAARIACAVHYAWPFTRGHWRLTRLWARIPGHSLRGVPFRSSCGVAVALDLGSDYFGHLFGRLSPEPLEVAIAARLARAGDVFIDVGAHRGLYILHVLGRLGINGVYVAFEPSPSNHRFLTQAFVHDPRLRLVNLALSDCEGEASLSHDGADVAHVSSRGAGSVAITTTRLDTFLASMQLEARTLFMKIDVEGHESRVLDGCSRLGSRGIWPLILIEFLEREDGQGRADILRAIEGAFRAAYRYFAIDAIHAALREFSRDAFPDGEVRNILAVPPALMPRLERVFRSSTL